MTGKAGPSLNGHSPGAEGSWERGMDRDENREVRRNRLLAASRLVWLVECPADLKRIDHRTPFVAPEHLLYRDQRLAAGGDRAVEPGLSVVDDKLKGETMGRLKRIAVIRHGIHHHDQVAVDLKLAVHQ